MSDLFWLSKAQLASDAKKLRALEAENAKLKKLLAEMMLDVAMLRDDNSKSGSARGNAGGWISNSFVYCEVIS